MDDRPIGIVLSRRRAMALLAAAGVGSLALPRPAWAAACVARPAQTEGPYFRDLELERSDLRIDPSDGGTSPGTPLALELEVSRLAGGACEPLPGARVDLWHADHLGRYSGVSDRQGDTSERKFLRGYQLTDGEGRVRFTTIYPGWYPGRALHIHFKIRDGAGRGVREFTSQLYFDDALTDAVHAEAPYRSRDGRRRRNDEDGLYRRAGERLMLGLERDGDAWRGRFSLALTTD